MKVYYEVNEGFDDLPLERDIDDLYGPFESTYCIDLNEIIGNSAKCYLIGEVYEDFYYKQDGSSDLDSLNDIEFAIYDESGKLLCHGYGYAKPSLDFSGVVCRAKKEGE